MLSYNVAGLLRSTPGTVRTYAVRVPTLDIAADLRVVAPVEGEVRLSRTGRSILARARLTTALEEHCSRCLVPLAAPVAVEVDEEALPSIDLLTGAPLDLSAEPEALRLDDHHELDLREAVREAISLAEPIRPLCRPDCRGLCDACGADLNVDPTHRHEESGVDPRLAALTAWRPPSDITP
ncbi:MAG: YceD family protein [Candidatus Limnocylindrales bacterium]